MEEIKKGSRWIKDTLKPPFQKAKDIVLTRIITVIITTAIIIAIYLLLKFLEAMIMLLIHEVAVYWLFIVVILSLVAIGTIHHIGTKKYNKLYEGTRPPGSVDKLIKAEVKYNSIGKVEIEGDPPHLIFYIRVINRTNYCFKPKKVFLACYRYYPKDLVCTEEWKDEAKSQHIYPTELQSGEDGSIQFHVPKEKIDDSKRKFTLKGHVEYTTEEDILHDNQRKRVKVNITKLEYKLDEETTPEPKGRVIIAK